MNSELQNLILRAEVLSKKNWLHAVHLLENAAESYPDEEKIYLTLGDIYAKKQQFEMAIAAYQKALAITPNDNYLKYVIGNCYFASHEYRMALAYFEKIKDPSPEVLYNRALALAYVGRHQDSIKMIRETLNYIDDNPFIYFLLIEQLIRSQEFDEALKYLHISEKKIGRHKHLLLLGAVIYTKRGIWLKAYNAFFEYESSTSFTNPDHLHAYGICAWKIGQYDKSVSLYRQAIKMNPYISVYYEDLIRVFIHLGDFRKANDVLSDAKVNIHKLTPILNLLKERIEKSDADFEDNRT